MDYIFQIAALVIISHVILGCLIVAIVAPLINLMAVNASTRHSIWLSLYGFVVLMPVLAFSIASLAESVGISGIVDSSAEIQQLAVVGQDASDSVSTTVSSIPEPGTESASYAFDYRAITLRIIERIPITDIGQFLLILILLGMMLKSWFFYRAHQKLNQLYQNSDRASDYLQARALDIATKIGISTCPAILLSDNVATPSTSGFIKPWIVLPGKMFGSSVPPSLVSQVLMHELAHVKRHDFLIAYIQSILSVFLFWHPALHFITTKVRHERELACDDWVVHYTNKSNDLRLKNYASCMLDFAKSVNRAELPAEAVACVRTRNGLERRIRLLLDQNVDHSILPYRLHSIGINAVVVVVIGVTAPLWPQLSSSETLHIEETLPIQERQGRIESSANQFAKAEPVVEPVREPTDSDSALAAADLLRRPVSEESGSGDSSDVEVETVNGPPAKDTVISTSVTQPDQTLKSATANNEPSKHLLPNSSLINESSRRTAVPVESSSVLSNAMTHDEGNTSEISENPVVSEAIGEPIDGNRAGEQRDYIIIDQLSKRELAREINKVQQEFYRVFNMSVDNGDLKITCEHYFPTGSFIKQRFCEPQFMIDARSSTASGYLNQTGTLQPLDFIRREQQDKFEELTSAMNYLLQTNAYFRKLNLVLRELRLQLG